MKKKLAVGATALLMGIASAQMISAGIPPENEPEFSNHINVMVDLEKDKYIISEYDKYGYEQIVAAGSWSGPANLNNTNWATIQSFTSIDWGNLRVTSAANNQGNVSLRIIRESNESIADVTTNLRPGDTWTGNIGWFFNRYRLEGIMTGSNPNFGTFNFTLQW